MLHTILGTLKSGLKSDRNGGSMKKQKKLFVSLAWLTVFSLALGAAWTSKRLTSNMGTSTRTAIAVNGANVYVVWQDDTPGNYEIYFKRSTDGGATWLSAKRLTFNLGFSGYPDIAVNGSTLYVAYEDDSAGNRDIFYRKSNDGGSTWESAKRITNNSGFSYDPQLAISGANVCAVWWDDTPGNFEIYFRKSTDGGATWQSPIRLTDNGGDSEYPEIIGYGSYIYVIWADTASGNNEIFFRRSIDAGVNWQSQKRLTNNAGVSEYASIAVGGLLGANLYAVWNDDTPGNDDIYFCRSLDKGLTWQASQKLTNNAGTSYRPVVAASGSNVYVAWYDDTPGNYEIYVRKSSDGGASWQAAQRITNNAGASGHPSIALNTASQFVSYEDNTTGDYEIFLRYAPL